MTRPVERDAAESCACGRPIGSCPGPDCPHTVANEPFATESREVWHVVSGSDVRKLLRRARTGEDPELLYIEWYANATDREDFGE